MSLWHSQRTTTVALDEAASAWIPHSRHFLRSSHYRDCVSFAYSPFVMSSTLRPRQLNDLLPSSPLNHQREPKRLHLSHNCFYTYTCTYVSPVPSSQYFRRVFLRCSSFHIRIRKKTSTSMAIFSFFLKNQSRTWRISFEKINNAVSGTFARRTKF